MESLSHFEVTETLERLVARDWQRVPVGPGKFLQTGRRRFGSVGDAVIEVLKHAGDGLTTVQVHREVEQQLGETVAYSSVKNRLARRCLRDARIIRMSRGRYALRIDRT